MSEVTQILDQIAGGDHSQAGRLMVLVYDELKQLAESKLSRERCDHTLQATALVHEAYLRLLGSDNGEHWNGRGHFFGAAAEAMRRILVENARRKQSVRGGGGFLRKTLADPEAPTDDDELLELDEALTKLSGHDAIGARIVEMRFFAGMGHEEIAAALDITVYRVRQKWTYARAWLRKEMGR